MIIGIPKEIMHDEARVAAIPDTVKKMVDAGNTVLFEKGAGEGSFYFDKQYAEAGATIVDDPQEIYDKAEVILKVKEPLFNEAKGKAEIDMMHKGQYLITFIHPAAPVNHEMVKKMAANGVIGLTLDGVPRIPRAQSMDALSSMSTCAGYKGILMGASDIPKFCPLIGSAVGMVQPSNVLVIGTGVAGLRAVATAKGLGARVFAVDIRPSAREQAMSLGAKIVDCGVPEDIAVRKVGVVEYAKRLPDEWLVKERENIAEAVRNADIIFCSALLQGQLAPVLLTDEMVASMKPGSAIVDISIDQGGNCAITTPGKRDIKHNVTIEGIKNIPGQLPTSSTWLFAHNICNLLLFLGKDGKMAPDWDDEIVKSILVTKDGEIVHAGAREAMKLN
ncbi:MAG: NAD(P) transhydrogenase subunit alpha [Bacteroidales bacterium]|nr:NAD(P) transhydrogenase subunit alpha [Candidatus Cacconaster merdequi]